MNSRVKEQPNVKQLENNNKDTVKVELNDFLETQDSSYLFIFAIWMTTGGHKAPWVWHANGNHKEAAPHTNQHGYNAIVFKSQKITSADEVV